MTVLEAQRMRAEVTRPAGEPQPHALLCGNGLPQYFVDSHGLAPKLVHPLHISTLGSLKER